MTDSLPIPTMKAGERIPIAYCAGPDDDLTSEGMRFVCAFPKQFSIWVRDRFLDSATADK